MPARKEDALISITLDMLKNENYQYEIQPKDDHEAFEELEQTGILNQTDDARKYYFAHDVYEELAVNHIFTQQYNMNIGADKFFAKFRTSLRVRKLFRGWLTYFAAIKEHQDIIFAILGCGNIDKIWKDEVLLTVISTEHLKEVYYKITSDMADDNYAMLKKIAFLINTCCRVAEHTELYFNRGNLMPFRLSKPSGYAWKALFEYAFAYKESINWDKEMASTIIEVLDSWTKHVENVKEENTALAGKIGLFLLEQLSDDEDLRYAVRSEQIEILQNVLVNSAWMIKKELNDIFRIVLDTPKDKEEDVIFANISQNTYRIYKELAKRAVVDFYHYGQIPFAMAEMTIKLMETTWMDQNQLYVYRSIDIDSYFGFETWLLNVVKISDTNIVVNFCRDVLIKSKNVMLTAVIVSIAEAYPEKMVDIVCDFLRTKELFHFDAERFVAEGQASFLLHRDNIFEEERRESNKLPHRRKRLEDIILQYQTNRNGISEEEYNVRLQKLYGSIDDATKDIDTWQTTDKYAYYRMDLRRYKKVANVEPDGNENNMCMVVSDFAEDMEKLRKENREKSDKHFQYMDLQLWSVYKFTGNEEFKNIISIRISHLF